MIHLSYKESFGVVQKLSFCYKKKTVHINCTFELIWFLQLHLQISIYTSHIFFLSLLMQDGVCNLLNHSKYKKNLFSPWNMHNPSSCLQNFHLQSKVVIDSFRLLNIQICHYKEEFRDSRFIVQSNKVWAFPFRSEIFITKIVKSSIL